MTQWYQRFFILFVFQHQTAQEFETNAPSTKMVQKPQHYQIHLFHFNDYCREKVMHNHLHML